MKAIAKRLRRLEDQFGPADRKPRNYSRLVLRPAGLSKPDLENSTCRRTLWPNGTVHESIVLAPGNNGRELTDDELDRWVASFPIEEQVDGIRPVPLPPPGIPAETL
jgi:hypothetical protein